MDLDLDLGAEVDIASSTEATAGPSAEITPPGPFAPGTFQTPSTANDSPSSTADTSPTYVPERRDIQKLHEPVPFTQKDFDNLAKDLHLSEKLKEVLGS